MKKIIKKIGLRIFFICLILFLILGILNKMIVNKNQNEEFDASQTSLELKSQALPDEYIPNQIALIGYEKVMKHFKDLNDADEVKDEIVEKIKEDNFKNTAWFVIDVTYNNKSLTFRVTDTHHDYLININKYQTLITKM